MSRNNANALSSVFTSIKKKQLDLIQECKKDKQDIQSYKGEIFVYLNIDDVAFTKL